MILERLGLCDFRAYRGIQDVELRPRVRYRSERPIILFGGLNGAGKTTLLLAVKLALYGRLALGIGTSKASYAKFIRSCIHSVQGAIVQRNSAYVELEFVYGKLGRQTRYVVRRNWIDDGRDVHETLSLSEDGEPQHSLSAEACQGFLSELVPIGVSELFFFDGEKIAELAEDDSGEALGEAIHRLLGLDLVERLRNDLRVYMLRWEAKAAGKDAAAELDKLQREYEELSSQLAGDRAALERAREHLDELTKEKDRLEVRLTERGGDWGASREAQHAKAKELAESLRQDERELREELSGVYPLWLATEALTDVIDDASKELVSLSDAEANRLLTGFARELKQALGDIGPAIVDQVLEERLRPEVEPRTGFDLSHRSVGQMDYTVRHAIPEAAARVERVVKRIVDTKENLDDVTLRIEQAPDEAVLAADFGKLTALSERIMAAGAEVAVLQREVKSRYADAIGIARALRDKHKALSERRDLERPLEYASGARSLLKDFGQINAERKVGQLQDEFSMAFCRLARKDDMVARAEIDPHRFTVKLLDRDGVEIQKSQLSAGERQIYAIAMLEALARTSGRRLPVVIDTPLGRLDSYHRGNLVRDYFPRVSHQVILLSTDTEVDESFYRELSPHISHAFEICYDEKERMANLRQGYFWRTRARLAG